MKMRRHWMGALLLLAACGGRSADAPKAPSQGASYPQAPPPPPLSNDQVGPSQPADPPFPYAQPLPSPGAAPVPGMPQPGPVLPSPEPPPSFATAEEAEQAVDADERDLLSTIENEAFRAANASQCTTACRALASMRRSVEGLCQLTGDADQRCTSARTRLAHAGDRVREAGCSCTVQ